MKDVGEELFKIAIVGVAALFLVFVVVGGLTIFCTATEEVVEDSTFDITISDVELLDGQYGLAVEGENCEKSWFAFHGDQKYILLNESIGDNAELRKVERKNAIERWTEYTLKVGKEEITLRELRV